MDPFLKSQLLGMVSGVVMTGLGVWAARRRSRIHVDQRREEDENALIERARAAALEAQKEPIAILKDELKKREVELREMRERDAASSRLLVETLTSMRQFLEELAADTRAIREEGRAHTGKLHDRLDGVDDRLLVIETHLRLDRRSGAGGAGGDLSPTPEPKGLLASLLDALAGYLAGPWAQDRLRAAGAGPDALGAAVTTQVALPTLAPDRAAAEAPIRRAIADFMLRNVGDPYTYGAEIRPDDPDPATGDCSEYLEHAHLRAGLMYPDGVVNQRAYCRGRRVRAPQVGDPFFLRPNAAGIPHTGVYVGDGMIVHAQGKPVNRVVKVDMGWAEAHPRFEGWYRHPDLAWPPEDRA